MKILHALTVFLIVALAAPVAMAQDRGKDEGLLKAELHGNLKVNQQGELTLKLVPAAGYKWNAEYPAKLILENGKSVSFEKAKLTRADFKVEGTNGAVTLKAKGSKAGEEEVKATLSASVCDKETCHVIRKRVIPLMVTTR